MTPTLATRKLGTYEDLVTHTRLHQTAKRKSATITENRIFYKKKSVLKEEKKSFSKERIKTRKKVDFIPYFCPSKRHKTFTYDHVQKRKHASLSYIKKTQMEEFKCAMLDLIKYQQEQ